MLPTIVIGPWDLLLIAAVSVQATVLAYLYHPRWKALVLTLPIPFTMASLALGRPIDATNILGLGLLLLFTHGVRVLHPRLRLPIVAAIVLSALAYCVAGWALAGVVPPTDAFFWGAGLGSLAVGALLLRLTRPREEPGHRSPLPLWIKLPAIMAVIFLLVLIKQGLQGFMTLFPMVGVVAAYEARHSLWTMCRQIPVIMLTLAPLMMTVRLTQGRLGLGPALALGWVVFLAVMLPLTRATWQRSGGTGHKGQPTARQAGA